MAKKNIENKRKTKADLFIELACPNKKGVSRWVSKNEFVGDYKSLYFENGFSWGRGSSKIAREYKIEQRKEKGATVAIRLNGKKDNSGFSQHIRSDIQKTIKSQRCVILGTSNPEVDHKNGMKNEARVMRNQDQRLSDFQPLSKAANDAKRQFCKECIRSGIRYDAKKLGYPISYYKGGAHHNCEENACVGCYWYDPVEFRKCLIKKGHKN